MDTKMGTTYNRTTQKEKRQYLRTYMTLAEKTLWFSLKATDMLGYKFRRQHGIVDYVVDFYCPELKLTIEADGESHESSEAKQYDARRQREMEKEGIHFLRFTDDEILGNADKVVPQIEREVMRLSSKRNHHPSIPSSRRRGCRLGAEKRKPRPTTTLNLSPLLLKGRIKEGFYNEWGGGTNTQ